MTRPVIGVTGLPCSGKSLAARLIADGTVTGVQGDLLKADDTGHEVLVRPEVVAQLRERFGDETFAQDDPAAIRRAIAGKVFANREALVWLEGLVHPLVLAEVDRTVTEATERPLVMEAALLFGSGMEVRCGRVLLIEADFAVRLKRAAARGWDRAELERREERQRPLFAQAGKSPGRDRIRRVANNADPEALRDALQQALSDFSG